MCITFKFVSGCHASDNFSSCVKDVFDAKEEIKYDKRKGFWLGC